MQTFSSNFKRHTKLVGKRKENIIVNINVKQLLSVNNFFYKQANKFTLIFSYCCGYFYRHSVANIYH